MYELKQIPYNYTVGVKNRFKGLDLRLDRQSPWRTWREVHNIVKEAMIKTIHKGKKMQKGKMVVWDLKTAEKRRKDNGKGETKRCIHLNAEFQRIAKRDKKAL